MNIPRKITSLFFISFFPRYSSMQDQKKNWLPKINLSLLLLGLAVTSYTSATEQSHSYWQEKWVATWASPYMITDKDSKVFENQTIRHIVPVSLGSQRVRIRISNIFGAQALQIGAVHIALHAEESSIVPGTDRTLKFGGFPSITIPKGAVAVSDPIELNVPTLAKVAVSLYLPTNTGPATYFDTSAQTTYISGPGNLTGATTLPGAEASTSRYFLSVVEASSHRSARTIVAIGDSVTKGATATSWPGVLFTRLNSSYRTSKVAVINQGIGCNRTLRDFCGPSAAARFDRDVLTIPGTTHVIIALGLVDIIMPTSFVMPPHEYATADDIIVGLKQLIERARAQGLTVYGATITPFGSSIFDLVYTPENEAKRKAVNRWIRTSGAFDAVIDFDAAVRDPQDRTRYVANYSDDGIHPNDLGNEVMAEAIDLELFE